MDRGAWQATVYGVTKSQTRLNDFTFTFTLEGEKTACVGICTQRLKLLRLKIYTSEFFYNRCVSYIQMSKKKTITATGIRAKRIQYKNINSSRMSKRGQNICSKCSPLIGQLLFPWQSMYSSDIFSLLAYTISITQQKITLRLINRHTWQMQLILQSLHCG